MQQIKVKINNQEYIAYEGQTILDVIRKYNIDNIPTLCHREDLKPYNSCFLCVVEVKGKPNLVPSCSAKVHNGMEIITKNSRIIASRKTALELILSNHYADCIAPCTLECPAHVDIQGYISLASMGAYEEAAKLIRKNNPFVSVCARVCVRKCENVCRRGIYDEAVAINDIKRYIADCPQIYEVYETPKPPTNKKVAIIGAGPSGLTAAYYLGLLGHEVHIYEALEQAGGMLRYGIPEYRLPKEILDKEINYILKASQAILYLKTKIPQDLSFQTLKQNYNAIYIATGAFTSNNIRIPNENNTKGIISGVDFLKDKAINPMPITGTIVVVGGGNTAIDAARVAVRLGAKKVIILYRRTKAQMPADPLEIKGCEDEGVQIIELTAPIEIIPTPDGYIKSLKCIRMKLGELDSSGRRSPIPIENSEFQINCDVLISAIGQKPQVQDLAKEFGFKLTKWDTIEVDPYTMMTSVPGVFAGGDSADDGPTVVIDAIADGKNASDSIHKYLCNAPKINYKNVKTEFHVKKDLFENIDINNIQNIIKDFSTNDLSFSKRHHPKELKPEQRKNNFNEIVLGFDKPNLVEESHRCLGCGCPAYYECDLRLYAQEYNVDINKFAGKYNKFEVQRSHPHIIYDPNKCVLCGRCIRVCSKIIGLSALGRVNRGANTIISFALKPLQQTNCINCGNCVDACPTGALYFKLPYSQIAAFTPIKIDSICPLCSLGCNITINLISKDKFYITSTSTPRSYLCDIGRFTYKKYFDNPKLISARLTTNNESQQISIKSAIELSAQNIKETLSKYGAESIAILASLNLSEECLSIIQDLAISKIKTTNIGSLNLLINEIYNVDKIQPLLPYLTQNLTVEQLFENKDLIIIINSNTEHYPYLNAQIINKLKTKSTKLIYLHNNLNNSLLKLANIALNLKEIPTLIQQLNLIFKNKSLSQTTSSSISSSLTDILNTLKKQISSSKNILLIYEDSNQTDTSVVYDLQQFLIILKDLNINNNLIMLTKFSNYYGFIKHSLDPALMSNNSSLKGAKNYLQLKEKFINSQIKTVLLIGEDFIEPSILNNYLNKLESIIYLGSVNLPFKANTNILIPYPNIFESSSGYRYNFLGQKIFYPTILPSSSEFSDIEILKQLKYLL